MSLHTVTITGADDHVRKSDLLKISRKYPFVEWGLLLSISRAGSPRYPTHSWLEEFTKWGCSRTGQGIRRSLHLCGMAASSAMLGEAPKGLWAFDRVQINGYEGVPSGLMRFIERKPGEGPRVILQCRSESTLDKCAEDARVVGANADVLFDCSGGRGEEPSSWPASPKGCRLGFAGGIGPDNVTRVLQAILTQPRGPFWIDMESWVRTDNRLDLDKVCRVLEQAAPYVGKEG